MDWTIDTGSIGARGCDAKDLRGVLEAAAAHFEATAPKAAENAVLNALDDETKKNQPQLLMAKLQEARAAGEAVKAKLPPIQKQIAAGINAACDLADAMGGQVTCTVAGHHYPEHPGGIFKRLQVLVDRAAPIEDDG